MKATKQTWEYVSPKARPSIGVPESAIVFDCSEKHVRDMLNRGELKGIKLGKSWRMSRAYVYGLLGIGDEGEASE